MIRRNHRFHGRGSLRQVYQQGKTVRTPQLGLRVLLREHRQSFRVAVVVGKAINKSAVARNRMRRRIYEAVRLHTTSLTQPYDLVFTVYAAEFETLPAGQVAELVGKLLKQAQVIDAAAKNQPNRRDIIDTKET